MAVNKMTKNYDKISILFFNNVSRVRNVYVIFIFVGINKNIDKIDASSVL